MGSDVSPDTASEELNQGLIPGRARRHALPARTLAAGCDRAQAPGHEGEPGGPTAPAPNAQFLIVDNRFGMPIHVFLELDPSTEPGFPGLRVRSVTLELPVTGGGMGVPAGIAIGQDPHHLDHFRTFRTERAVATAGFILIEPRYVGPNWPGYLLAFRPGGEKPGKRPGLRLSGT